MMNMHDCLKRTPSSRIDDFASRHVIWIWLKTTWITTVRLHIPYHQWGPGLSISDRLEIINEALTIRVQFQDSFLVPASHNNLDGATIAITYKCHFLGWTLNSWSTLRFSPPTRGPPVSDSWPKELHNSRLIVVVAGSLLWYILSLSKSNLCESSYWRLQPIPLIIEPLLAFNDMERVDDPPFLACILLTLVQ